MAIIKDDKDRVLATGLAEESKNSTFINKTSYVENAETSAWGRALGNLGIGLDTSVASADEVVNAISNQNKTVKVAKETKKEGKWTLNIKDERGPIFQWKHPSKHLDRESEVWLGRQSGYNIGWLNIFAKRKTKSTEIFRPVFQTSDVRAVDVHLCHGLHSMFLSAVFVLTTETNTTPTMTKKAPNSVSHPGVPWNINTSKT